MNKKLEVAKKEATKIVIPSGKFAYVCCADCRYGDYDSSRGQVWCGHYRKWFSGSDSCSYGERR